MVLLGKTSSKVNIEVRWSARLRGSGIAVILVPNDRVEADALSAAHPSRWATTGMARHNGSSD